MEIAKSQLQEGGARAYATAQTLARVFDICLRLLHPFTPFVTEELWGHLRRALQASPLSDLTEDWPEVLIIADWPEQRAEEGWEADKIADFELIQDTVRAIRNLRSEKKVKPSERIGATIVASEKFSLFQKQIGVVSALSSTDLNQTSVHEEIPVLPEGLTPLVVGSTNIYLSLPAMGEEDRARLEKELAEAQSQIARLEKLLGSDFANKAPEAVVNKEREKLAAYKDTAEKIKAQF